MNIPLATKVKTQKEVMEEIEQAKIKDEQEKKQKEL